MLIFIIWFVIASVITGIDMTFYDTDLSDAALESIIWPIQLGGLLTMLVFLLPLFFVEKSEEIFSKFSLDILKIFAIFPPVE